MGALSCYVLYKQNGRCICKTFFVTLQRKYWLFSFCRCELNIQIIQNFPLPCYFIFTPRRFFFHRVAIQHLEKWILILAHPGCSLSKYSSWGNIKPTNVLKNSPDCESSYFRESNLGAVWSTWSGCAQNKWLCVVFPANTQLGLVINSTSVINQFFWSSLLVYWCWEVKSEAIAPQIFHSTDEFITSSLENLFL